MSSLIKLYHIIHKKIFFSSLISFVKTNQFLSLIVFIYILIMFSVIRWGIPNNSHPFAYHMDEWHQLQAVRNTFRYGTPNIVGSAHGPMFQFILSGIYLIPFLVLGIIQIPELKSPLEHMEMQEKLFMVLRFNTLIFGILSILFLYLIAKKYVKINPLITVLLFITTPLWIALSNYYKYDIALVFWIILSVFMILRYAQKQTVKNYILAGIPCALALSTKISAIVMIPLYIFSFFYFSYPKILKLRNLLYGLMVFFLIILVVGFPDVILRKGDYSEFLHANLVASPKDSYNFLLGTSNEWQYLIFELYPRIFGHSFYTVYIFSLFYFLYEFLVLYKNHRISSVKSEIFIFTSFLVFALSLIPLGIWAVGNRVLVLLPFLSLLSAISIHRLLKRLNTGKPLVIIVILLLFIFQTFLTLIIMYPRVHKSIPLRASEWMVSSIRKNELIGIENIPIYQNPPDIILREYYLLERNKKADTHFKYVIVDAMTKKLPDIVVVTNAPLHEQYIKNSPKKELLQRLKLEGYKKINEVIPYSLLRTYFGNDLNYHLSGLNIENTITIYKK